jgi:hypothetical protein
MRMLLIALLLTGCPAEPPVDPGPDAMPVEDARTVDSGACADERIAGPYSPVDPLYGEACTAGAAGCRPDPAVPGGYAGVCVAGVCRPICGFYEFPPGVAVGQCCLRGGVEVRGVGAGGLCACQPVE